MESKPPISQIKSDFASFDTWYQKDGVTGKRSLTLVRVKNNKEYDLGGSILARGFAGFINKFFSEGKTFKIISKADAHVAKLNDDAELLSETFKEVKKPIDAAAAGKAIPLSDAFKFRQFVSEVAAADSQLTTVASNVNTLYQKLHPTTEEHAASPGNKLSTLKTDINALFIKRVYDIQKALKNFTLTGDQFKSFSSDDEFNRYCNLLAEYQTYLPLLKNSFQKQANYFSLEPDSDLFKPIKSYAERIAKQAELGFSKAEKAADINGMRNALQSLATLPKELEALSRLNYALTASAEGKLFEGFDATTKNVLDALPVCKAQLEKKLNEQIEQLNKERQTINQSILELKKEEGQLQLTQEARESTLATTKQLSSGFEEDSFNAIQQIKSSKTRETAGEQFIQQLPPGNNQLVATTRLCNLLLSENPESQRPAIRTHLNTLGMQLGDISDLSNPWKSAPLQGHLHGLIQWAEKEQEALLKSKGTEPEISKLTQSLQQTIEKTKFGSEYLKKPADVLKDVYTIIGQLGIPKLPEQVTEKDIENAYNAKSVKEKSQGAFKSLTLQIALYKPLFSQLNDLRRLVELKSKETQIESLNNFLKEYSPLDDAVSNLADASENILTAQEELNSVSQKLEQCRKKIESEESKLAPINARIKQLESVLKAEK